MHVALLSVLDLAAIVIAVILFGNAAFPFGYILVGVVLVTWFFVRLRASHRAAEASADES
jgi:hypothetical protein